MSVARWTLIVASAVVLATSGAVVAGGRQDAPPQDARPASDPIGDTLRQDPTQEAAPSADPAPAVPIAITPPPPAVETTERVSADTSADEEKQSPSGEDKDAESDDDKAQRLAADTPTPRQRRRVAIVEAIDKITAASMRFEVEVGGPPVRFNNNLIFTARACEVSADNELVNDAIAYLDITVQPRATPGAPPRQVFRGWMFSSTPAVSGLQHPIYDAWIVGCKA